MLDCEPVLEPATVRPTTGTPVELLINNYAS